jgi:probable phosphoglycerate mutase
MPIFLLIRHGDNDYLKEGRMPGRIPGIHLNETGRKQADDLACALADLPIKAIYSSPLERAVETAQPLAQAKGLEIQVRPGLIEGDVGKWEGKSIRFLRRQKLWSAVLASPSRVRFPGGESTLEIQSRLINEIEAMRTIHKPGDLIACFLHADPIKIITAHYTGLPLDNFQRLAVETGSVTVLMIGDPGIKLLGLNLKPPFKLNFPQKR